MRKKPGPADLVWVDLLCTHERCDICGKRLPPRRACEGVLWSCDCGILWRPSPDGAEGHWQIADPDGDPVPQLDEIN